MAAAYWRCCEASAPRIYLSFTNTNFLNSVTRTTASRGFITLLFSPVLNATTFQRRGAVDGIASAPELSRMVNGYWSG
jgi:hypothetical protein